MLPSVRALYLPVTGGTLVWFFSPLLLSFFLTIFKVVPMGINKLHLAHTSVLVAVTQGPKAWPQVWLSDSIVLP